MKLYLIAIAVYAAFSFLPVHAELPSGKVDPTYNHRPINILEPLDTYGLQRRMNQQYQNQQLQDQMDRQQQQLQYQQQQEHMRNQGWGRPGLDGPRY